MPGRRCRIRSFAEKMTRADGLAIVVPEYNHGYPGPFETRARHVSRGIHSQSGRVLRRLGRTIWRRARDREIWCRWRASWDLAVTFTDLNFSRVGDAFDDSGKLKDEKYVGRAAKFLNELVWMSRVLRYGREKIPPL